MKDYTWKLDKSDAWENDTCGSEEECIVDAIATGYKGRAKGTLGCYIVLAERDDEYKLVDVKAVKVDGVVIKADTYYTLVNGKFVECEE